MEWGDSEKDLGTLTGTKTWRIKGAGGKKGWGPEDCAAFQES